MYTILKQNNEALKERLFSFAAELIEAPSVSFEESEAARITEKLMLELGYDKIFRDDFGNVVGVLFGMESQPTLLLNSHLDTVAADPALWEGDPFKARLSGGRLYGLGAADCKGGLAAQIYAGGLLKKNLLPLKGNLVVAASVAEQNGISLGVRGLLEHTLPEMGLSPSQVILGEPTGEGLYYGHDGWLELNIDIEGANPFQVTDVARSVYEFIGLEGRRKDISLPEEYMLLEAPRFEDRGGYRRSRIRLAHRLHQPGEAEEVLGRVGREVGLVAGNGGGAAVKVALRRETRNLYNGRACQSSYLVNAWSTDPFSPLVEKSCKALRAAGLNAVPGKWRLERLHMGTAGNVCASEFNIPTIGYGPGREEQAHAANEFVELESLARTAYGTAAIAHSLVGIPVFGWTSDDI